MRIAVLPLNAGPNTDQRLARQITNFAAEIVNQVSENEVGSANLMAQIQEGGVMKAALINPSEEINDDQFIEQSLAQTESDYVLEGLLTQNDSGGGTATVRIFDKPGEPVKEQVMDFLPNGLFGVVRGIIDMLLEVAGGELDDNLQEDVNLFGTEDPVAYTNFLRGYDDLQYMERSQGNVLSTFDPKPGMDCLLSAVEADKDWEAPFIVLIQFCRAMTAFRIGNAEMIQEALNKLIAIQPQDPNPQIALGELAGAIGNAEAATNAFEQANRLSPDDPGILHRLAQSQLSQNMPVNAERNLRRAVELEDENKPSLDLLSRVLINTGRAHEVPELWNDIVKQHPQNGRAHASYALALLNTDRKEEGMKAFEDALEKVDDKLVIKRAYAPVLANENDLDRAMDFYEDVIEEEGGDIGLQLEYAQTLQKADREFEIPDVLKQVLSLNPDPNTRAQTMAWLVELEQPKRAEAVQESSKKAESGDFEGAIRDLKPLKTWLGDYWKMWMVLATCHNQLEEYDEAEKAARTVLEMFPSCEPAYVELNNALSGQEKFEEAFGLMEVALGNIPNSLPIAVSYGLAAKRVDQPDIARNIARQIREAVGEQEGLKEVLAELEK